MILIYEFANDESPEKLTKLLWDQGIGHRIIQEDSLNQIWLLNPQQEAIAKNIIAQWQANPEVQLQKPTKKTIPEYASVLKHWRRFPMTLVVLVMTGIVALLTGLGDSYDALSWFTISPFEIVGNSLQFYGLETVLEQHEYWRLLTPALIHFGAAHLIFNALWIWDLGRKLELLLGSIIWVFFILFMAIASNVGQFLLGSTPMFGGLSGVVHGLVSFAWVMPYILPGWPKIISKSLMVFFVVWLLLGYTDVFAAFGLGKMANSAHLLGLVSGLICAGVYRILFKILRKR